MKRINLLFDATIIAEHYDSKTSSRSGIFWVAYNLLNQFNKNPLFKITLLISHESYLSISETSKNSIFSRYKVINKYEKNKYINNILVHKDYIKNSNNIIAIFIRYLKILKNYILYFFYYKFLNGKLKKNTNFDFFFSPIFTIPDEIDENKFIKKTHMLHDCIPVLENLSSISNMTASLWFTNVLKNLNKETFYFCNSECTKNDFLSLFPNQLDKNKMFVTLLASSQYFFPIYDKTALMKVLEKYKVTPNINNSYLFSLCSIDPRKNLVFTIKCFIKFIDKHKIDNFYFYLGGASFGDYIDKYLQETSLFSDYQDKILQLGYIDDEDLNILYSNSLFFTFLSQYEGFGIPPLEAMQAGTPVICSNNSSLPEVVGDAAIMIDCNSEEQCIKAFEEFYFNEDLRKEYIKKGLERSKLFSWDKTVKTMTDIIKARH